MCICHQSYISHQSPNNILERIFLNNKIFFLDIIYWTKSDFYYTKRSSTALRQMSTVLREVSTVLSLREV